METISEKLVYLNETKSKIKDAINHEYELIDDTTTFREYADKIKDIEYNIKEYIPSERVSGVSSLKIDNGIDLLPSDFQINGVTEQDSTNGYNLAEMSDTHFTINNDIINFDGTSAVSIGIALLKNTIPIEAGQTVYINYIFFSLPTKSTSFMGNDDISEISLENFNEKETNTLYTLSYTATEDLDLKIIMWGNSNADSFNFQMWICKGTNYTDYESYTGGEASPNPDYPQESVSVKGKNLLNPIIFQNKTSEYNSSVIFYTVNYDGSITQKVSDSRSWSKIPDEIYLSPGTYTLVIEDENDSTIQYALNDTLYTTTTTKVTFTVTAETSFRFKLYGATSYPFTFKVMLYEGDYDSNINYEPYNSVKVENKRKNLLDLSSMTDTKTINGIAFTNNGDSTFDVSGTATANTSIILLNTQDVLESGKSYYLYSSKDYDSETFNISVKVVVDSSTVYYYIPTQVRSFTWGKLIESSLSLYIPSGTSVEATNVKLMLVQSDTIDKVYEPYVEPKTLYLPLGDEPLRGIDAYKDKIIVNTKTGVVSRENNISEVVFDGSENWLMKYGESLFHCSALPNQNQETQIALCSHFILDSRSSGMSTLSDGYFAHQPLYNSIFMKHEDYTTVDEFKEWLSKNNVIVDYILATPTTEEITILTEEELKQLKLFLGYNNITIDNDLATLDMTYFIDYKSLTTTEETS